MPTSATASNPARLPCAGSVCVVQPRSMRGFTLVELMVVFAIIAMIVGLVPVAFDRMMIGAHYRDTVRTMLTDLRTARYLAQSSGQDARFIVNLQQRTFGIEGGREHKVPEALEIRTVVAQQEVVPNGGSAIRFLPRGGASGGSVDILRPSGSGVRLRVDWFTGRVEQEPVAQ